MNLMKKTAGVLALLLAIACASCNRDNKRDDLSEGGIKRYEIDLFSIDTARFEQGVEKIWPKYKVFLGDKLPDEQGMNRLREFVTDNRMRSTYEYCLKVFPDLEELSAKLDNGLQIYTTLFPAKRLPQVYTYISGFDIQMPVKFADSALIISLDLYLGPDYTAYKEMGYPVYITNRLSSKNIAADCFREIAWANIPTSKSSTLLDAMIEEGKSIYFAQSMLPDEPDENLTEYSPGQLEWVVANEQNLWSFMIENQLLYSTDAKAITMFMTDGPFTSGFSSESPARTGHWLGWQIVKAYMSNNDVSLPELLSDTDSQTILQKSGYKPVRI